MVNTDRHCLPSHVRAAFAHMPLICKPIQERKHATPLFLAHRAEGTGKVRAWCIDYLSRPEVRAALCGETV